MNDKFDGVLEFAQRSNQARGAVLLPGRAGRCGTCILATILAAVFALFVLTGIAAQIQVEAAAPAAEYVVR